VLATFAAGNLVYQAPGLKMEVFNARP